MKTVLRTSVLALVLSLLCMSVFADCTCKMKNAKGQTWVGTGPTRAVAAMNAQKFCAKNSKYVTNCENAGCKCQP